jgi:hypothetical protein
MAEETRLPGDSVSNPPEPEEPPLYVSTKPKTKAKVKGERVVKQTPKLEQRQNKTDPKTGHKQEGKQTENPDNPPPDEVVDYDELIAEGVPEEYARPIADGVLVWKCGCGEEREGTLSSIQGFMAEKDHRGEKHKKQLVNNQTGDVVATSRADALAKKIYPAPPPDKTSPPPPGGDGNLSFKGGLVDLPTAWPAEALVYYNMVIQFGLESGDMTFQEWAFKCMDWAMTGHYGVELVLRHVDERKTLAPELKEAIEASVQKVMAASKGKKGGS